VKRRFLAGLLLSLACLAAISAEGSPAVAPQSAGPGQPQSAPAASAAAAPAAAKAPAPFMTLTAAAAGLKARLAWDPVTKSGYLERAGVRANLAVGLPWLLFDYRETLPADPPREGSAGPELSSALYAILEKRFSDAEAAHKGHFSIAAILIDPGHGGKDPGAVGEHVIGGKKLRVVEKDLALDVSLRVYKALKERFPDKRIYISRSGDSYPTLEERVAMANEVPLEPEEAIIYVSIHANASFNKNSKGFEVWYLNPDYRRTLVDPESAKGVGEDIAPILNAMLEEEFTTESIMLARKIVEDLQLRIGKESPSRGVRAEEWFVVRNVRMPSVLVEMGFVTNPEEASLLATDDYLKRLSDGIYTGIVDFVGYFETMRGPPSP
jgi:N-acetylmuramoyl-L-alanine amidase